MEVAELNPRFAPRVLWSVGSRPFYGTDAAKCFTELRYGVERTSIYTSGDVAADSHSEGISLACTEHLSPVFLMWPGVSFNVDVDCPAGASRAEVPMMDGSAILFFNALRSMAGAS